MSDYNKVRGWIAGMGFTLAIIGLGIQYRWMLVVQALVVIGGVLLIRATLDHE